MNDLRLYIDNTAKYGAERIGKDQLTQRGNIHRNLARKIANNTYDHGKAAKLFRNLVDRAAKDLGKFSVADRNEIAQELADRFIDSADHYQYHVDSGVYAKRIKAAGGWQKLVTIAGGGALNMADVKRHNKAKGFHFFSKGTMGFFYSRIESNLVNGQYFVTSEQFETELDSFPRLYTVRKYDKTTGRISTHGDFQQFKTCNEALDSIRNK